MKLKNEETGEEFEFTSQVIDLSCHVFGVLKPIKKKIDWGKVGRGVLVRDVRGVVSLHDLSSRQGDELDTEHWQYWGENHPAYDGDRCPLPKGVKAECRIRGCAAMPPYLASEVMWNQRKHSGDVIAFKVVGLAEGWEY